MEKEILLKEIENTNHLNELYQLWNEFKAYLENQPSLLELGNLFGYQYHLSDKLNQLSLSFLQEKKYKESIAFHQELITYFKDDKYLCPFYKNLALSFPYFSISSSTTGLGPIIDISPFKILIISFPSTKSSKQKNST